MIKKVKFLPKDDSINKKAGINTKLLTPLNKFLVYKSKISSDLLKPPKAQKVVYLATQGTTCDFPNLS